MTMLFLGMAIGALASWIMPTRWLVSLKGISTGEALIFQALMLIAGLVALGFWAVLKKYG